MIRLVHIAVALSVAFPAAAGAQTLQTAEAAGPFRVAYFSFQRAFSASRDAEAARVTLSSLQAERSRTIEGMTAKLKALQDSLQQSASILSETARAQREREIARFEIDVQRFIEDAQAEFLGVQREIENAFLAKLRPALAAVATDRGLLLVLNEDTGLFAWADPALDITAEVLKRADAP